MVRIVNGLVVKVQDGGQREKVICEVVQSSSGLWAFNQSVPRIMSCVAREVT